MGPGVRFETKHRAAEFTPGDRAQITETLKRLYNGNVGTITDIECNRVIRVRLVPRQVNPAARWWGQRRNSPASGTAMPGQSTRIRVSHGRTARTVRQLAREEIRAASAAWATADELAPAQQARQQRTALPSPPSAGPSTSSRTASVPRSAERHAQRQTFGYRRGLKP
jgi:hypothetical protein